MLAPSEFEGSLSFESPPDDLSENPSTQLCVESPSVVLASGTEEMMDDSISERASASVGACFGG